MLLDQGFDVGDEAVTPVVLAGQVKGDDNLGVGGGDEGFMCAGQRGGGGGPQGGGTANRKPVPAIISCGRNSFFKI